MTKKKEMEDLIPHMVNERVLPVTVEVVEDDESVQNVEAVKAESEKTIESGRSSGGSWFETLTEENKNLPVEKVSVEKKVKTPEPEKVVAKAVEKPVIREVVRPEMEVPKIEVKEFSEEVLSTERSKVKWGLWWVGTMIFVAIVSSSITAWVMYQKGIGLDKVVIATTPTPEPVVTPVPSPAVVVVIPKEVTLSVKNGSGIKGMAKKVMDTVTKKLEWKVGTTGNAEAEQKLSSLHLSDDLVPMADMITATLKSDYPTIIYEAAETVKGSMSAEIVIGLTDASK